jgi:hypothetical protein
MEGLVINGMEKKELGSNKSNSYLSCLITQTSRYIYIYIYIYIYKFQNVFLRCPTPRLHCFLSSHSPSFRFLSDLLARNISLYFRDTKPVSSFKFYFVTNTKYRKVLYVETCYAKRQASGLTDNLRRTKDFCAVLLLSTLQCKC